MTYRLYEKLFRREGLLFLWGDQISGAASFSRGASSTERMAQRAMTTVFCCAPRVMVTLSSLMAEEHGLSREEQAVLPATEWLLKEAFDGGEIGLRLRLWWAGRNAG